MARRLIATGAFDAAEEILPTDDTSTRALGVLDALATGQFVAAFQFYADRIPESLKLLVATCSKNAPALHRAERKGILDWWVRTGRDRALLDDVVRALERDDPEVAASMPE